MCPPPLRQSAGGSTLYMQHLMGDYLREYGRLVDSPTDGDKGLDNFTAAAKVLSTGHRRGAHNHTDMGTMGTVGTVTDWV